MRAKLALVMSLGLLLAPGCEFGDSAATYVETGIATRDEARAVATDVSVQTIMQGFQIANGRAPESLEELEQYAGDRMPNPPAGQSWALEEGRLIAVDSGR